MTTCTHKLWFRIVAINYLLLLTNQQAVDTNGTELEISSPEKAFYLLYWLLHHRRDQIRMPGLRENGLSLGTVRTLPLRKKQKHKDQV